MKRFSILGVTLILCAFAVLVGCATNNVATEQQAVTALASLGTTGALIAYPQYRPAMQTADTMLISICDSSNGVPASTVEQLLAQSGITNQLVQLGISGAVALADIFAANQVTNGVPAEQTIQQASCWISAGMTPALAGAPLAAKEPARHWYYLWIK